MILARVGVSLTLVACVAAAAAADVSAPAPPPAGRPRIGLVLGGGGAKGAAHIGVLKVLEEMRIPVDCIAGTSMGAIVGAAYATGLSAAEIEKVITAVEWKEILASAPREEVPVHRKSRDFAFTNGLELGVKDGSVISPGGLVPSHQIEGMFRRIVAGADQARDFDRLPIPFRAVATDLETGDMVVFDSGDLAVAMRASMAVPAAFAPVEHRGPAAGRRHAGAQLAGGRGAQHLRRRGHRGAVGQSAGRARQARHLIGVAGQAMNIAIEANENAQLATLTDKDVAIKVILKDIGSSDFYKVPEAIPIGEAAARAAPRHPWRATACRRREYARGGDGLGPDHRWPAEVKIDEVRLTGLRSPTRRS